MLIGCWIGDPTHHATQSDVVHREKAQIVKSKSQTEMNFPKIFIQHPTKHLRVPSVNSSKDTKDTSTKENIVNVGHDKISVMHKNIHWSGSHENS